MFCSIWTPRNLEGGKDPPTLKISALLRKRPVLLKADFVLTKDRKRPSYRHFCGVKCTGRGLVLKRPGVLSKVQMLTLVLGVGGLFPSSNKCQKSANKAVWGPKKGTIPGYKTNWTNGTCPPTPAYPWKGICIRGART